MSWLSEWLKELILVVMFAAFADLLLPSQTMQRYVRTVLGLFILMMLIQPVLAPFREKWDTARLASMIDSLGGAAQTSGLGDGIRSPKPSLQAILLEAEKMKTGNLNESRKLAEARMAQEINRLIGKKIPAEAVRVSLATTAGPQGEPEISRLQVILRYLKQEGQPDKGGDIRPVAPVSVQIDIGSGSSSPARPDGVTPEMEQARRQITRLIQEQWQLTSDQVSLFYDTESPKLR